MRDAKALDGQIPVLPGDDCHRPTPQKHGAELSQEASWVGQRLEREELSVGGVDRETKESHKTICSLYYNCLEQIKVKSLDSSLRRQKQCDCQH